MNIRLGVPIGLNKAQKELVKEMFFGPYKPEWKNKKGLVDNSDSAIGKRLGVSAAVIAPYTDRLCSSHFKTVIEIINNVK